MKRKTSMFLLMTLVVNMIAVFATVMPFAETVVSAATVTVYSEDFQSYKDSAAAAADSGFADVGPRTTYTPKLSLGTDSTNKYLVVTPARGTYRKVFPAVPVNSSGGTSPGVNVKLKAQYKIARESQTDNNQHFFGFVDKDELVNAANKVSGGFFIAGDRGADSSAKWRFSNDYSAAAKGSVLLAGDYAASAKEWVTIRYEMNITDASGNFISPLKTDVYVNDVLKLDDVATLNGSAGDKIDALDIWSYASGAKYYIDDILVTLDSNSVITTSTPIPTITATPTPVPPTPSLPPAIIIPAYQTTIYQESFESYSDATIGNAGYTVATDAPAISLGTDNTQYIQFKAQQGKAFTKLFPAVPVKAAGGASPGKNAVLIAEYKIMSSCTNSSWRYFGFGDSDVAETNSNNPNNVALAAGFRGATNLHGSFRYTRSFSSDSTNDVDSSTSPNFIVSAPNTESVDKWHKIKYVVKLTDDSGAFVTPVVDVYYNDERVLGSKALLATIDEIDLFKFNATGTMEYGLDDVKVVVATSDAPSGVKVSGYLSATGATVTLAAGRSTTTDSNGYFEFTGVSAGAYTLTISKSKAITRTMPITVAGTDYTVAPQNSKLKLYVGDFNDDGNINITDYVAFLGCYGAESGTASYIASVDYDNNGIINITDYVEFLGNYGGNASLY